MDDGPVLEVSGLWQGFRTRSRHGGRVRKAEKKLGEKWALRGVDLVVQAGELVGVVGANGSGKSTLLRTAAGVYRPERGSVLVRGRVSSLIDLESGVHRDLTGRENLLIVAVMLGMSRAEARRRYEQIRNFSGISEAILDQPYSAYSAGMILRINFSVVLNSDPSLLLVDEVLAVGDEAFQRQCVERIEKMRAAGCGILLVSHDLSLVAARADRVVVLERGSVVDTGPAADVLDRYRERAAADSSVAGLVSTSDGWSATEPTG